MHLIWLAAMFQMTRWSKEARHEDTSSLKTWSIDYLPCRPEIDVIEPPLTRTQGKSVRGFNHPATARLLCPFKDLEEFDKNPQYVLEISSLLPG
jgi:hypothetical protein